MQKHFTTRQAAKKLGLDVSTLSRYISSKKVPAPQVLKVGAFQVHSWTEEDIERIRGLLPKIANGRKTRHKKQSAVSNQQSEKAKAKKQKKKNKK
jgi:predicted transcriptional regulator